MTRGAWLVLLWAAFGCSSAEPTHSCEGPPGMYVDSACTELAGDLRRYTPRFPLWSDGAEKERFISIPPGSAIDTSEPDDWIFPVGTRLFKTFSHDGVRLETRILTKRTEGAGFLSWDMQAFAWDADQRSVHEVARESDCPDCAAMRKDVLGTTHDIPSASQCRECHRASRDIVNGFSATQLNHGGPGLTLGGLVQEGLVSEPGSMLERSTVPGDGTTQDALGYLHANCGHCHRYGDYSTKDCSTPACLTGLVTFLRQGDALEETGVFQSAVGKASIYRQLPGATCRISAGHPESSMLLLRMQTRDAGSSAQMPKLGSEVVDAQGVGAVREFILGLAAGPDQCE